MTTDSMIANAGCGSSCLPEQQEIVRLLDEQFEVIERNEREIDAALKRSEALRQAILKKAFRSPGPPPSPVRLEQLQAFNAPMLNRNPKLQFAFAGAKIAEGRGFGMKTFGAAASKYRLPLPKYSFDGVYLNLTIYRHAKAAVDALAPAIVNALSGSERTGWGWLASKETAKSKEYAAAIESDERTARRHLNHFLDLKLVRKTGSGPSTEYHVQR